MKVFVFAMRRQRAMMTDNFAHLRACLNHDTDTARLLNVTIQLFRFWKVLRIRSSRKMYLLRNRLRWTDWTV